MKSIKIQLAVFAALDIILGVAEIHELLNGFNDPILLFCSLCAIIGAIVILLRLKDHRYHGLAEVFSYINIAISLLSAVFSFVHHDPLEESILTLGELVIAVHVHVLLGKLHEDHGKEKR